MDNVIFPPLYFDKPGVYHFTMKELTPSGYCWKTDRRVYRVTVTVEVCKGRLRAHVAYPDGNPCFCNVYTCCRCGKCRC